MRTEVAPTPRDVVTSFGTAKLLRFLSTERTSGRVKTPILLVPSLINRWYVLDLREGASLVASLLPHRDVYCLDFGAPEDEDRYLTFETVVSRVRHAVRTVRRESRAERVALLGYCMGGTLAAIHTALHPDTIAGLVNLAGPIDFEAAGILRLMVDERWFDPVAITAPGNIAPVMMQSGFMAMQPTVQISKWVNLFARAHSAEEREAFAALDRWASDNVAFPGAAYVRYIQDLYQQNLLLSGRLALAGRRVDLGRITCPVLTVVASRDAICPPKAATALNAKVSSADTSVLEIPGGHVGAVVGKKASDKLYPALEKWLREKTDRTAEESGLHAPADLSADR
ncbi:MAG: alpha/beta fold hydrolase [Deltaproteobacteria bacterium]|nr:alpha/beta fold hydrolase [Deltaproteobacteria bacterium]